jgi:UDP-glucose 4-epimerase
VPRVVLVTGVSRFLGTRLAAQLEADPAIERVIGIDTVAPPSADRLLLGRTEFVRADIRNPLVAKVVAQAGVDTVVHAGLLASPRSIGGRVAMQETNVIGTMQLLAACQKSDTVERVVVRSTTAVYGSSSTGQAVYGEDVPPYDGARGGFAKDAIEVEGYVRGFVRRRPDIVTSVLRLATLLGPAVDTEFTRYLRGPVVPTVLGFDPRLQLLHESDAVEALRLAATGNRPGIVNVAAEGVVTLSQVLRRTGRRRLPVPAAALGAAGAMVGNPGAASVVAADAAFLSYGRVVDTTRLHHDFGFTPRWTTARTVEDFASGEHRMTPLTLLGLGVGSRWMSGRQHDRPAVTGA